MAADFDFANLLSNFHATNAIKPTSRLQKRTPVAPIAPLAAWVKSLWESCHKPRLVPTSKETTNIAEKILLGTSVDAEESHDATVVCGLDMDRRYVIWSM